MRADVCDDDDILPTYLISEVSCENEKIGQNEERERERGALPAGSSHIAGHPMY